MLLTFKRWYYKNFIMKIDLPIINKIKTNNTIYCKIYCNTF